MGYLNFGILGGKITSNNKIVIYVNELFRTALADIETKDQAIDIIRSFNPQDVKRVFKITGSFTVFLPFVKKA